MKKHIPLILALAIPILMIIFVAASIYLPGIFFKPKYDFIYLVGDSYYSQEYGEKNNKLVYNPKLRDYYSPPTETKIFYYDINQNKSREISFAEAQILNLDSNSQSPDGFQIVYGSSESGVFPFFFYTNRDYNSRYIQGHNVSRKLNINLARNYYDQFQFIGWIIR